MDSLEKQIPFPEQSWFSPQLSDFMRTCSLTQRPGAQRSDRTATHARSMSFRFGEIVQVNGEAPWGNVEGVVLGGDFSLRASGVKVTHWLAASATNGKADWPVVVPPCNKVRCFVEPS